MSNSDIKYGESLLEISKDLFEAAILISESAESLSSAMSIFNNDSFGYLGKAKENTTLLCEGLSTQMNKLAQFYAITSENVYKAYEAMQAQDVYISKNLTMY